MDTVKIIPLQVLFPELKMYCNNSTNPKEPQRGNLLVRLYRRFMEWLYSQLYHG